VNIQHTGHEYEFEPQHGLPERLPADERILWQGAPDFRKAGRTAFHLRTLAIYFAVVLALRAYTVLPDAASLRDAVVLMALPTVLAVLALGTIAVLAWLACRTTVYTLTDRRVVMRVGVVLTLSFNLPLKRLRSADVKMLNDGCGDIALTLSGSDHIAYFHLWPHVRSWRLAHPEPTLRSVPDAAHVAALLSQAWSQVNEMSVQPMPTTVSVPAAKPATLQPSMS